MLGGGHVLDEPGRVWSSRRVLALAGLHLVGINTFTLVAPSFDVARIIGSAMFLSSLSSDGGVGRRRCQPPHPPMVTLISFRHVVLAIRLDQRVHVGGLAHLYARAHRGLGARPECRNRGEHVRVLLDQDRDRLGLATCRIRRSAPPRRSRRYRATRRTRCPCFGRRTRPRPLPSRPASSCRTPPCSSRRARRLAAASPPRRDEREQRDTAARLQCPPCA